MPDNDIQYYSSLEKELKHSQIHKAKKFIEFKLIEYDKESKGFICKPIPGYNFTTYKLTPLKEKIAIGDSKIDFECDCQGFQTKKKKGETPFCSHLLALHYWFDLRNREMGYGRYKEG